VSFRRTCNPLPLPQFNKSTLSQNWRRRNWDSYWN